MKEKSKSEVSIIGGADGPTSIFIAGRTRKKPLKKEIEKQTAMNIIKIDLVAKGIHMNEE